MSTNRHDMADIEDLKIKLQILLCQANMEVIKAIPVCLGIEQANWKGKNHRWLP